MSFVYLCIFADVSLYAAQDLRWSIRKRQNKVEIEIKVLEHNRNTGLRQERMTPRKD